MKVKERKAILVTAEMCSPCKKLKSDLDNKGIQYEIVSADDSKDLLMFMHRYGVGVTNLPTTYLIENLRIMEVCEGYGQNTVERISSFLSDIQGK